MGLLSKPLTEQELEIFNLKSKINIMNVFKRIWYWLTGKKAKTVTKTSPISTVLTPVPTSEIDFESSEKPTVTPAVVEKKESKPASKKAPAKMAAVKKAGNGKGRK